MYLRCFLLNKLSEREKLPKVGSGVEWCCRRSKTPVSQGATPGTRTTFNLMSICGRQAKTVETGN